MSLQLGRTREGSLVLHRDRISESTAPRGQGLSEEGLRRSLAPYLYGVSDRIVVLHTATGGWAITNYGGMEVSDMRVQISKG